MLHSYATDTDDPTEQPRWGRVGKQKIEDTGPLTQKRMETVDDEFLGAAQSFINRAHEAGKPFFVWFNPSRMHFYTHIRPEHKGISGPNGNFYSDGMVELDNMVGSLLDQLDKLGIAENTIVINSTDNGPHYSEWPDGGITPFRSEKNTNWEGAYRVPCEVRWPGKIPAGAVSNGIVAHQDWLPTLLAAAGDPDIKEKTAHRPQGRETRPTKFTSTGTISFRISPARKRKARAVCSSTRQTAARSPLFAMTIGKSSTWCSEQKQRTSGESL